MSRKAQRKSDDSSVHLLIMYDLKVNDVYIDLMHKSVSYYLKKWPGGDPEEQESLLLLKAQLDRLKLEVLFDNM